MRKTYSRNEILDDIAEIYNRINGDLDVEEDESLEVYKTKDKNLAIVKAIKKYTLKVIDRKYKKYGGK